MKRLPDLSVVLDEEQCSVCDGVAAVIVRQVVILAHIAYKQAVGFHGGKSLFRESAGCIRISALLAKSAAAAGKRQDMLISFREHFSEFKAVFFLLLFTFHHAFIIH